MFTMFQKVDYLVNTAFNRVICPYCGYKLPLSYSSDTELNNLEVYCKGRHCHKTFNLIIHNGIQKNLFPDDSTIEAFKVCFGSDYKEHIWKSLGVDI